MCSGSDWCSLCRPLAVKKQLGELGRVSEEGERSGSGGKEEAAVR